ncbi:MAG: hypothetical protein ACYS9X_07045 [Planctomycetota bacterium]
MTARTLPVAASTLVTAAVFLAAGTSRAADAAEDEPSIAEMLVAVGESVGETVDGAPGALSDVSVGPAGPVPRGPVETALAEIDSLLVKHDYAAAQRRADLAASATPDGDLAAGAAAFTSAAGVARALEKRRAAMRDALEPHEGTPVTIWTRTGRRKGDLESVSDAGVVVATKTVINGQVRGVRRHTVAWRDLTPSEQERLSKSWTPAEPEGTVARAVVALARGDEAAAEKALLLAGGHPYAAHILNRIAARRRAVAEAAAARTWQAIARLTRTKLDPRRAGKADALLKAFEKDHASSDFVKTRAEEIAKLREKVQLATAPDFPLNYALATNGATASGRSHPEQLNDGNATEYTGSEGFSTTSWGAVPAQSMVVTLAKATPVNVAHFRLWDGDNRHFRYRAAVSPDAEGDSWIPIADFTDEEHERRSWQTILLPLQLVRRIRVTGTYNSANSGFYIVELEAYHAPVGFTAERIHAAIEKVRPARPPHPPRGEGD